MARVTPAFLSGVTTVTTSSDEQQQKTNSDSQLWQLAVIAIIDNGYWQSAVEFQCNEETQMFLFVDIDLKASQGNSNDKQQTISKQTTNKKHQQTIIKTNK